jgi:hypothetical protein
MTQEQHGTIILILFTLFVWIIFSQFTLIAASFFYIFGVVCFSIMIWTNFIIKLLGRYDNE